MEATQVLSDYERERGKPVPSLNHAVVQTRLIGAFSRYAREYSIASELSLELDGRPYVPDISIYPVLQVDWRHDHVKKTEPPLMVVEILSPTQPLDDLVRNAEAYFEAGVKSCWIVQPVLEAVVVLLAGEKPTAYTDGEVADPTTGITVTIKEIFHPVN
ncbi:MAG: Uma2 family endonuclease [bacterium]|nr:Uma2 family endonuclease [bacterium]